MKIAFVTFEFPPLFIGGAGVYAMNITRELASRGHRVVVFAPALRDGAHEVPTHIGVQLHRVPINSKLPWAGLQFWLQLPQAIKRAEQNGQFDLVHFNGCSYWFAQRKLAKAPHIMTVHHLVHDTIDCCNEGYLSRIRDISGETSPILPYIERRGIEAVDHLIAVSDYTRRRIMDVYGVMPDKVETTHSAIDFNERTFSPEELDQTRARLGIPDLPIILFVGRVDDRRKGLDHLLQAFEKVSQTQRACLLVVGSGNQTVARRLAASLRIKRNVFFAGTVREDTLRKCYALCTVYVCPSRLEGFGLTLLEAMAAGKPVVATNVGSIPELVSAHNGSLVDSGDIDALSSRIGEYLAKPTLSQTKGAFNARDVRHRFHWEKTARATEQVYDRVAH